MSVVKVTDGIWVCSGAAFNDLLVTTADITAVIDLDGSRNYGTSVDVFDFMLPDQELLDEELPPIIKKLNTIATTIKTLRDNGRNILISCPDGRNKSMLAVGYYLLTIKNAPESTIDMLDTIRFTPEQKCDDMAYKQLLNAVVAPEVEEKRRERQLLRSLTLNSFRKILYNVAKK